MHSTENVKCTVVLREIRFLCTRLWQRSGGVTERSVSSCRSLISRAACGPYWNTCQLELLSSDVEVTSWWCPICKHCRIWLSRDVTGDVDKILILEFIMTRNVKVTVFWNMTPCSLVDWNQRFIEHFFLRTRFVQKVSGLTTVHEVDKAYGVLTLIVFNTVPFRSYTLRPTLLPLLETFCELLFRDV